MIVRAERCLSADIFCGGTRLLQAGQRVAIADKVMEGAASPVAAGLFNVVNSRRPGKSWRADELVQEVNAFFQDSPWASLRRHAYFGPIFHPFRDERSREAWQQEAFNPEYEPYVELQDEPLHSDCISNPFGGLMVKQGGWVDVHSLIKDFNVLQQTHGLEVIHQLVETHDVDHDRKSLRLESGAEHKFDHIVYCQGWRGAENAVFPFLPVVPNKGEILKLSIPGLQLPFPVFKKVFLVPLGDETYICGSTYARDFASPAPTEEGKNEILSALQQLTPLPARVLSHVAGVRPSSHDWRPIVGTHPNMDHVHVFTGFGAHGGSLSSLLLHHDARLKN